MALKRASLRRCPRKVSGMMPTDVMPEKARGTAESLLRLIRQHVRTEGEAGEVESFAILASALADLIGIAWNRFLARLNDGAEAERVRTDGAALSSAADLWLEMVQSLQDTGTQVAVRVGAPIKGLSGEIRETARKVVDSVNAACNAPPDQEMLRQSEADVAAARFRKGKEVIARLRSRKLLRRPAGFAGRS